MQQQHAAHSSTVEMDVLKEHIQEVLHGIYPTWKRADAVRILSNKRNITQVIVNEFQTHRERAMGLLFELETKEKVTNSKQKQVEELKKRARTYSLR